MLLEDATHARNQSTQVLLQAAFLAGNVRWVETREARRVLLLLGFPKAESPLDLVVVRS